MEESKKVTACLTQIYGENTSKKYKLKCSEVTIGRSFHAEIRLKNPNVSRNHCTLLYSDNGWKVRDNKSQNGTYVNGQKLQPRELQLLQCGDIIFLGPPSEMPEAFCYDDAFLDEENSDDDNKLASPVPLLAKRPAEHEVITTSKRKSSDEHPDKIADAESNKISLQSVNNEHSKEDSNNYISRVVTRSPKDKTKLPNTKFKPKDHPSEKFIVRIKLPSKSPFQEKVDNHSQNVQDGAMYQSATSSSMLPHRNELPKLSDIDNEHQINEISSTDQVEDSQSLIDLPSDNIHDPFYSTSCSTEVLKEPNSESQTSRTPEDTETLKSKLELLSKRIKNLEKSKSDLLKNYNDVCEKNKTLDEQLVEQKKFEDQLKNCELKAKDAVKNELLEKFEEDLICNVCTELLIKPTVLDCSHTFCQYCIKEWRKKKNDCPICRRKIQTMTPVLTLEHFIEKALSTLTPEQRDKRLQLIKEREKPPIKVPTPRRQRRHRRYNRRIRRPAQVFSPAPQHDVEIIAERRNAVLPLPLPNISLQLPMNNMYLSFPEVALLSESDGDSFNIYIG